MKQKKMFLGILVIMSLFIFACSSQTETEQQNIDPETASGSVNVNVENNEETTETETEETDLGVRVFYVEGGPMFEFYVDGEKNPDMVVRQGETVRIVYESVGGMPHDWVVDEIEGARTEVWQPGEGEIIEFVANEVGEFEYYCSVGQHRENGMKGKFIVQ